MFMSMFMSMTAATFLSFAAAVFQPGTCGGFKDGSGNCHSDWTQCQNAERPKNGVDKPSGIHCQRCCSHFLDATDPNRLSCSASCPPSTHFEDPTDPSNPGGPTDPAND